MNMKMNTASAIIFTLLIIFVLIIVIVVVTKRQQNKTEWFESHAEKHRPADRDVVSNTSR
jgi:preprotein translocase subunit YajC